MELKRTDWLLLGRAFTALIAALGLAGCGTAAYAPREHVVLVDHTGTPLVTDDREGGRRYLTAETNSEFAAHLAAITAAIAADTNCIGPDGRKRILIFAHGGLNTYNVSLARVTEVTPKIGTNFYPLFINWDSGLKSSYLEHLFWVRQGEVHKVWGPLTSPFYLLADLGRAVTRAPVVWYYQWTSDL